MRIYLSIALISAAAMAATGCSDTGRVRRDIDAGDSATGDGGDSDTGVVGDTGMLGDTGMTGDTGGGGLCTGVDCSSLDSECTMGACNPSTGECEAQRVPDGTACEDGDTCTAADVCAAGVCGGMAIDCSAMTDMCNVGMCDPTTGACVAMPVTDGTACDDGSMCSAGDTCTAGTCGGTTVDCSAFDDMCNAGTCDPTTGACSAAPLADGTVCDDADRCTSSDMCNAGTCTGSAVDCSAMSDACNVGTCDPSSGACAPVPSPDGTACDDADACTAGDTCRAGVCAGDPGARFDFETSAVTHEWSMSGTAAWIIDASGSAGQGLSNANIGNSQSAIATLDVTYAANGTVSFWRRTSTERNYDYLRFYIDGVQQGSWSGTTSFARLEYPVGAGDHSFEWRYTKDGSVSSGTDTVTIDDVVMEGGVTRQTFERSLPASFVMSGNQPWVISTNASTGTAAIESGTISHSQSSVVSTTVRIPGAGTVSFARATSSERSFDYLRFYVDGVQRGSWSGTNAYSTVSFPLTAGTHDLQWRYTKDGSVNSGADKVYIDDIAIDVNICM